MRRYLLLLAFGILVSVVLAQNLSVENITESGNQLEISIASKAITNDTAMNESFNYILPN